MKDIVVKIPGARPDIVMFATHYDTKTLANFVGADDGASSTAVMLELARLLCARKNQVTLWIAFFDGEEAFNWDWQDPVSYTHLDVYKRQVPCLQPCAARISKII